MADVTEVNDNTFDAEVLQSDKPVLVDFWATWCGPCKALNPLIKDLAATHADTLKVVKVDIGKAQKVAMQFKIRSVPTLLVIKNGNVVGTKVGASGGKAALEKLVSAHI